MINLNHAKQIGDKIGINWSKVDLKQFQMGLNEELEHRDVTHGNLIQTGKIAHAHLRERKDYYSRLKRAMK